MDEAENPLFFSVRVIHVISTHAVLAHSPRALASSNSIPTPH